MPRLEEAERLLEAAEQAAAADDLARADELLGDVARIQEAELGPLHPDLANTLNNRAVIAERTGQFGEAESFYRRAFAIASASLPAGDPAIAASRQNLEDFCRAHGLPLAAAAPPTVPSPRTGSPPGLAGAVASGSGSAAGESKRAAEFLTPLPPAVKPAESRVSTAVQAAPVAEASPAAAQSSQPVRTGLSRSALAAIGVAVLVVAGLLLIRSTSSSSRTSTPREAQPANPQPTQPSRQPGTARRAPVAPPAVSAPKPPKAEPVPENTDQPATASPSTDAAGTATTASPSPRAAGTETMERTRAAGGVRLVSAQLCRNFSTGGGKWACDPIADGTPPGPLVLLTRVASPADTVVVHRWFRGDTLRQQVKLTIRANANEGYRTFTRQTVDAGADWRVEVLSADGTRLHEQRFSVR